MSYEINKEGIRVTHEVRLSKTAVRSLQEDKIAAQMEATIARAITGGRKARGWSLELSKTRNRFGANGSFQPLKEYNRNSAISGEYIYHVWLEALCVPLTPRKGLETEFAGILSSLDAGARYNGSWSIDLVDGKEWNAAEAAEKNAASGEVGYAPIQIPSNFESYFSHLYGLDAQIARLKSALVCAVDDGFRHRFHAALIGPPGCGKSDTCSSLKKAVGEDAVMEFDATSTTMAGAQKELAEREELPRLLLVEEIEKVLQDSSSAWLLSVLDMRGEIRKTTARSNILKDTRVFCVATVNDEDTFRKLQFGALASRFMHKIHYNRPSREMLERIVLREIGSLNSGNPEWAKPCLDYCEEHNLTDPREVIAVALSGGDAWLDGSYAEVLKKTSAPKWKE